MMHEVQKLSLGHERVSAECRYAICESAARAAFVAVCAARLKAKDAQIARLKRVLANGKKRKGCPVGVRASWRAPTTPTAHRNFSNTAPPG